MPEEEEFFPMTNIGITVNDVLNVIDPRLMQAPVPRSTAPLSAPTDDALPPRNSSSNPPRQLEPLHSPSPTSGHYRSIARGTSLSLSLSLGFIDVNVDFFNDDHDAQNIDDNDLRHIQDRNDRRLEVSLKVCSELIARNAGQCFGLSTTLQIPSPSYLRCSRLGWNSIHCGLE